MDSILLKLRGITRRFPGVLALSDVSFDLRKGEVHALCGENGAGKSTLMNILSGNLQPDHGSICFQGREVVIQNQYQAQQLGIAIVHQEKSLVDNLTIADNIFAGNQPNRWGFIDRKRLYRQTQQLLDRLQLGALDPRDLLAQLSPGKQQMVEIAKALALAPDILILDEPTAAISEQDTQVLFDIVRQLTAKGTAVIYISHRMTELFDISDRISVLKDGILQGTRRSSETDVHEIIRMMVGRDLQPVAYKDKRGVPVVLEVNGASGQGFEDLSFEMRSGEILGVSGLVGAGRTEMARALFGADPLLKGSVKILGKEVHIDHPLQAIKAGLGYVPENRKQLGLFLDMSVLENLIVTRMSVRNRAGGRKKLYGLAREYYHKLDIRAVHIDQQVALLSGGNQQKIVLAKWLALQPHILIVDEPTQGVDVGAKSELYRLLHALAEEGTAILMISSDLPELLGNCDRILVMCQGRLTAKLDRSEFSEETIMHYSSGIQNMFGAG